MADAKIGAHGKFEKYMPDKQAAKDGYILIDNTVPLADLPLTGKENLNPA